MTDFREPIDVRQACRQRKWTGPTASLALGYVQANLVILPQDWAYDFLLFCVRNPKPCPLLEVTDVGNPVPRSAARDADLRTDLPAYRVWRDGVLVDEPHDIVRYWRDDLVAFLIGCSFSFEAAMLAQGLPVRHIELHRNVPMYRTNIACQPAGRFRGPMVVSMRPMTPPQAIRAAAVSRRFPKAHGGPIHLGDPAAIGIHDIRQPDYGDAVPIHDGEIPVFWACGVTPQAALLEARPPLAITHKPGHMFVTDWRDHELDEG